MSDKPKNPPAFPVYTNDKQGWIEGMTLLDYFAAKALQGILSDAQNDYRLQNDSDMELLPRKAYGIAVSMLKEREKHL